MRNRMFVLVLVLVALLSACSGGGLPSEPTPPTPTPPPTAEEGIITSVVVTIPRSRVYDPNGVPYNEEELKSTLTLFFAPGSGFDQTLGKTMDLKVSEVGGEFVATWEGEMRQPYNLGMSPPRCHFIVPSWYGCMQNGDQRTKFCAETITANGVVYKANTRGELWYEINGTTTKQC